MSNFQKRQLGDKMKREADAMRCPACGRGAALKASWAERRVWCRWTERGLCDYDETIKWM